jgi:hypothetical protein
MPPAVGRLWRRQERGVDREEPGMSTIAARMIAAIAALSAPGGIWRALGIPGTGSSPTPVIDDEVP